MNKLLVLFLLFPATAALAQSRFDGTWIIEEGSSKSSLEPKPVKYLVTQGMLGCSDCFASPQIKADGQDQKVPRTAYWDTVSARIVDDHTVEIIAKQSSKIMYTEVDKISTDGATLTQTVTDTTESTPVTSETFSKRVDPGSPGAHILSGSWLFYKKSKSKVLPTISYKCTSEGFSAWTPLGERYDAKFDGKDYPVQDDPGHTTSSVKRISPNEVEITAKREGKVISIRHLQVQPDGKSIHATFENKQSTPNSTSTFEMTKQQ